MAISKMGKIFDGRRLFYTQIILNHDFDDCFVMEILC